ncbi:methylated-DNA--[protein]-cysteine S-methyltransferase [Thalassotalea sp. G20_0]|uniref:methylated-DNA--[protein]-cysteine S-methyltransferase n=1 Tax=Thalassotalea sp. G20_0 TaxID=2821093 RepID=UPI00257128B0|nr:methylated-DNA--[protein]-cysteine S-methyltransferase [Thalassotalea sp. G20_0]
MKDARFYPDPKYTEIGDAPMYAMHKENLVGCQWLESPVGRLNVMASVDGVVSVKRTNSHGLQAEASTAEHTSVAVQQAIDSHLAQARDELGAYFRGELTRFTVALDLRGTDFQQQVWSALQQIGYGKSCSYQDIASSIRRPKAVRAVGAANGANPVAIIVPCHRVIGKNGKLTGYAYGVEMKKYLLDLEQGNRREGV